MRPYGFEGGIGGSAASMPPQTPVFSNCDWTTNLTQRQLMMLRDRLQVLQHRERRMADAMKRMDGIGNLMVLLKQNKDQRMIYRLQKAYTPHNDSYQEAQAEAKAAADAYNTMLGHIKGELNTIKPGMSPILASGCLLRRLNPRLYYDLPVVSFMLQYYKRPWFIKSLVDAVEQCSSIVPIELLVNVDHPAEHAVWAALANNHTGNFSIVPVFSPNVHEARGYNRLAWLARGRYLVVLQDDEKIPSPCTWLRSMITIFERWPNVAMVGLRNFVFGWDHAHFNNARMWFRDPVTKVAMQFVFLADYAPVALRRTAFKAVGGIDEGLMEPGECAIQTDWELCKRLWLAGYQVAYMELNRAGLQDSSGNPSGTHTPTSEHRCWGRQNRLSGGLSNERHGDGRHPTGVQWAAHIRRLNLGKLELIDPGKCPYIRDSCNMTR